VHGPGNNRINTNRNIVHRRERDGIRVSNAALAMAVVSPTPDAITERCHNAHKLATSHDLLHTSNVWKDGQTGVGGETISKLKR
jgi:hypothetical protein